MCIRDSLSVVHNELFPPCLSMLTRPCFQIQHMEKAHNICKIFFRLFSTRVQPSDIVYRLYYRPEGLPCRGAAWYLYAYSEKKRHFGSFASDWPLNFIHSLGFWMLTKGAVYSYSLKFIILDKRVCSESWQNVSRDRSWPFLYQWNVNRVRFLGCSNQG